MNFQTAIFRIMQIAAGRSHIMLNKENHMSASINYPFFNIFNLRIL